MTDGYKYAILAETSGEECETWYYFIRWNGNEEALRFLAKQINSVDMYILDDKSAFDIDIENLVSETTAKEMIKVKINSVTFHRKFNGKLKTINLHLDSLKKNKQKIRRISDKLGMGKIEKYASDEEYTDDGEEITSSISDEEDREVSSDDEETEEILKDTDDEN